MTDTKEKRYKWRREDYRENTKGLLMVNTGDAGRGMKCVLVQFMKSKTDRYGEHESLEKLGIEVHTMGAGFTWDTKDNALDIATSEETWDLCVAKMRSEEYDLLVFDELVYVLDYKFLDLGKVLTEVKDIRKKQPHLHIIMTGRNAPAELIEAADLVTEMKEIKHPFHAGIYAQQGIEF
jgi:cob(I)alamin adenosyltransferase